MAKIIKQRFLKRVVDIAVSILLLPILLPFFLLVIISSKIEGIINPLNKGPIFYSEIRISRGKPFNVYKFRTVNANVLTLLKEGKKRSITEYTSSPDKKKYLTPLGTFLAQIYLDELPQFFNVLKGDMSLVGPRPHIPEHYNNDLKIGMNSAKFIKAGVMGLGQASKGNPQMEKVFVRMAKKYGTEKRADILVDRLYLRKYLTASFLEMLSFDAWIVFRCLIVILQAKGM